MYLYLLIIFTTFALSVSANEKSRYFYPSIHEDPKFYGGEYYTGALEQFDWISTSPAHNRNIQGTTTYTKHTNEDDDGKLCVDGWARLKFYIPGGTTQLRLTVTGQANASWVYDLFASRHGSMDHRITPNFPRYIFNQLENGMGRVSANDTSTLIFYHDREDQHLDLLVGEEGGWVYFHIAGNGYFVPGGPTDGRDLLIYVDARYTIGDTPEAAAAYQEWRENTYFDDRGNPIEDTSATEYYSYNNPCSYSGESDVVINLDHTTYEYRKLDGTLYAPGSFASLHKVNEAPNSSNGALGQYLDINESNETLSIAHNYTLDSFESTEGCVNDRERFKVFLAPGLSYAKFNLSNENEDAQKVHFQFGNSNYDFRNTISTYNNALLSNNDLGKIYAKTLSSNDTLEFSKESLDAILGDTGEWLYIATVNTDANNPSQSAQIKFETKLDENRTKFANWLLNANTLFTNNGDPVEESILYTDNNICDGEQQLTFNANLQGTPYQIEQSSSESSSTSQVSSASNAQAECDQNGGQWYEDGGGFCVDGGSSTSGNSSSTASSSGIGSCSDDEVWNDFSEECVPRPSSSDSFIDYSSSSTFSSIDTSEAKAECDQNGGQWYEDGGGFCVDGGSNTSGNSSNATASSSSTAPSTPNYTEVEEALLDNSFSISGYVISALTVNSYENNASQMVYIPANTEDTAYKIAVNSSGNYYWQSIEADIDTPTIDGQIRINDTDEISHQQFRDIESYIIQHDNHFILVNASTKEVYEMMSIAKNNKLIKTQLTNLRSAVNLIKGTVSFSSKN
jgi:hypothetical protein